MMIKQWHGMMREFMYVMVRFTFGCQKNVKWNIHRKEAHRQKTSLKDF